MLGGRRIDFTKTQRVYCTPQLEGCSLRSVAGRDTAGVAGTELIEDMLRKIIR